MKNTCTPEAGLYEWMDERRKNEKPKADAHSRGKPQALCKRKPQDEHRFLTEENKTQK